jgi:hypothetical protein
MEDVNFVSTYLDPAGEPRYSLVKDEVREGNRVEEDANLSSDTSDLERRAAALRVPRSVIFLKLPTPS